VFDDDTSNNLIIQTPKGPVSIDPAFNPATTVTVGIAGQGVDILDPPGSTRPPVVTTTGTNLVFLQQPSNITPGGTITPPVSVRVYDNAGAPLPGAVSVTLENAARRGAPARPPRRPSASRPVPGERRGAGPACARRRRPAVAGVVGAFDVVQPTTPALVDITNHWPPRRQPKAVTTTTTPVVSRRP
jgi:hypothetical protein